MKQKILLPALHRGKERRCSRLLLRKSKLQHLRLARVRAASSTSWTTWGLAGMRGAPLSCEAQHAWPRGQRWMVHHAGAGCAGSPRSAAVPPRTAGRSPRRCRRTALPGRWGCRESMPCATRASMAVSSGSGAAVATTPEGGSPTAPSS